MSNALSTRPSIDILYITYNRLAYTRKTLPAMIENAGAPFRLTIFDNGSRDGTAEYLQEAVKRHSNAETTLFLNEENVGIAIPTNIFWKKSKADYIGKVDNDTLLPKNWLARLLKAHQTCGKLGVIGGFHFDMGYFAPGDLERRVIAVDGVRLIPDAFIGGCCYLMPRRVQQEVGLMHVNPNKKTHGWTEHQCKILHNGHINGYLYPLLHVEHFDDPLSKHNLLFSDFLDVSAISLNDKNIAHDKESMLKWYARDAARVVSGESLIRENATHLLRVRKRRLENISHTLFTNGK